MFVCGSRDREFPTTVRFPAASETRDRAVWSVRKKERQKEELNVGQFIATLSFKQERYSVYFNVFVSSLFFNKLHFLRRSRKFQLGSSPQVGRNPNLKLQKDGAMRTRG